MFLLRSAFWLTAAFLVIRPDVDMRQEAESLSSEAMARGSQFVAQQIQAIECDSFQCHGGKAVIAAALPEVAPVEVAPTPSPVPGIPLPRPRPAGAG